MQLENEGRYLPGDRAALMVQTTLPPQNNAVFDQMESPDTGSDLADDPVVVVKATRITSVPEKLLVSYSREYSFRSVVVKLVEHKLFIKGVPVLNTI